MTSRDFCYWLQGFFELTETDKSTAERANVVLTAGQVNCLKRHLAMVFAHEIDPSHGPKEHQSALSALHSGTPGLLDGSMQVKLNC